MPARSHHPTTRIPRWSATYRLQLGGELDLGAVRALVPYLDALGVSTVYLSPIARSRGTGDGYHVTEPGRVEPALGGGRALAALQRSLRERGMTLLLDVVPNHLAASPENPWWRDVLARGRSSPHAGRFDIDWDREGADGRVLVPVLSRPFDEAIAAGEVRLDARRGRFAVRAAGQVFPLSRRAAAALRDPRVRTLTAALGPDHPGVRALLRRPRAGFEAATVRAVNRTPPAGRPSPLEVLLDLNHYRLAFWRVANEEINYRRFFNVSDLVAVRQEDLGVFRDTHALALRAIASDPATGLRIDHVDGLRDPRRYLERLRDSIRTAGGRGPVLVEKILARGERIPDSWPVTGTTGYEFMNLADGVLVDAGGAARLAAAAGPADPRASARDGRRLVLDLWFRADVAALSASLRDLAGRDPTGRGLSEPDLRGAVVESLVGLPVYRTYLSPAAGPRPEDRRAIRAALEAAEAAGDSARPSARALAFLRGVLLAGRCGEKGRDWALGWQQLAPAVAAKGVEDTALYRFAGLTSRADVGADPASPASTPREFHLAMADRARRRPGSLNATSTHDAKRGEDVRARIHVLSEVADLWLARTARWRRWNAPLRGAASGHEVPLPAEEEIFHQALIGCWPAGPDGRAAPGDGDLTERMAAFALKVAREAKIATSWADPDPDHEAALERFVRDALDPGNERFRADVGRLAARIGPAGASNGLALTLLKVAAPGIPDVYQGTETWWPRLVDPDNRARPDLAGRAALLAELDAASAGDAEAEAADAAGRWWDGRVKLLVLARALRFRRANPDLFAGGRYLPLRAPGPLADHVLAFARRHRRAWAVAAVPRLTMGLPTAGLLPLGAPAWGNARLHLPDGAPERWRDVLTGRRVRAGTIRGRPTLPLADILAVLPVALLAPDRRSR